MKEWNLKEPASQLTWKPGTDKLQDDHVERWTLEGPRVTWNLKRPASWCHVNQRQKDPTMIVTTEDRDIEQDGNDNPWQGQQIKPNDTLALKQEQMRCQRTDIVTQHRKKALLVWSAKGSSSQIKAFPKQWFVLLHCINVLYVMYVLYWIDVAIKLWLHVMRLSDLYYRHNVT